MIKLQIIGHLGKDCLTNAVNGKTVINFNVAHTEKFTDGQGVRKERTIWVECAYWTDRTAVAPYLKKGTLVFVEGNPDVRSYQKTDGTTGVSLTMRVANVQLLGGTGGSGTGGQVDTSHVQSSGSMAGHPAEAAAPIDDLPF